MSNKLVDYKNRKIEIGQKVRVESDIPSVDGMLYKNSIVKIDEWNKDTKKIRVTDSVGKVWWVESNHISASFLQENTMSDFETFNEIVDEIWLMVFGTERRPKPKRARGKKGKFLADDPL